jgi:hypothetical protein
MVYYEEPRGVNKFELTAWAKRRLMLDPPIAERIRRITVDKWSKIKVAIKKLLLPKH